MPPHRRKRVSAAGFTLVELMITVAIIAIIAAVAMPIYNGYIERSYIQQGLQHLSEARTRMEQYYMDNRTYSSGGVTCGFDVTKFKTGTSSKEKFDFSCLTSATGDTYTVTAKGMTGTPVEGFTYTIDQAAIGTSTISKAGWNSGSCWILKAGEKCT